MITLAHISYCLFLFLFFSSSFFFLTKQYAHMKRSHFSDTEPRAPGTFFPFFLKATPSTLTPLPFFFFHSSPAFLSGCLHISSYLCHFCLFITHSFHLLCFYSFNFFFRLPLFFFPIPVLLIGCSSSC